DCIVSSTVSPDPRERPLVGQGIHRVDQRHKSQTAFQRTLSAPFTRGPGLLRSPVAGGEGGTSRNGPRCGHCGILLLPLLVWWERAAYATLQRGGRFRKTGFPLLSLLGQSNLDRSVVWRSPPDSY